MKVLCITGSTKGIGFCLSEYLKNKYKIIIHGKSDITIQDVKKKLGENENIHYINHNLLNNPNELIDKCLNYYGKLDILVNNCAIGIKNDQTNNTLQLNALVPYELSKYAIQKNIKKIINISSGAAIMYQKDMIEYCLSKNILESITKHLAYQYYDKCIITGLRIDSVFKTNMSLTLYSQQEYETFLEPKNLIPIFLTILKMGKESSGKIYSYNRSKDNLYLETKFNNNFVFKNNLEFKNTDDFDGKYISNGENKFSNEYGKYPSDKSILNLEKIISNLTKIPSDNIILNGGGISNSFDIFCKHFINDGDEVICHSLTFNPLLLSIIHRGGILKLIQPSLNSDYSLNYHLEDIIINITSATKMIYLVHPTYIYGDIFDKKNFKNILDQIPKNIPIIIDECYIDYFDNNILNSYDYINDYFIFGLRTFSKLYGLTSYRLGYIVCNKSYKTIIQNSFTFKSVPSITIEEVSKSLSNKDIFYNIKNEYLKERNFLKNELYKLKIKFQGNTLFFVIFVNNKDEIINELEKVDIIIPDISYFPNSLLYTIGKRNENIKLINIFKKNNI